MSKRKKIEADIASVPYFNMEIDVPNDRDPRDYIDQFLGAILGSECLRRMDWAFVG